MNGSTVRDGIRLALGTLSVLPVSAPTRVDRAVGRAGMLAAPGVGVLLGALAAGAAALGHAVALPTGVTAVLVVGLLALITRGLHLDGLADTADGLAASYDRERALTVMRRGDVGPAGAVTLLVVLLAQVLALAACLASGRGPLAVGVAVFAGRAVLPLVCSRGIPTARPDGLGAAVAGTVPRVSAGVVALLGLAATGLLGFAVDSPVVGVVVAVLVGWLGAGVVVARCVRRLGGLTGDVIGAAVEVTVTGCLVVLSAGW